MEVSIFYEHLMEKAFNCKRFDYLFVNADFYRNAKGHSDEYPAYMLAAMIVMSNKYPNEAIYKECAKKLNECRNVETADEVLRELQEKFMVI